MRTTQRLITCLARQVKRLRLCVELSVAWQSDAVALFFFVFRNQCIFFLMSQAADEKLGHSV